MSPSDVAEDALNMLIVDRPNLKILSLHNIDRFHDHSDCTIAWSTYDARSKILLF